MAGGVSHGHPFSALHRISRAPWHVLPFTGDSGVADEHLTPEQGDRRDFCLIDHAGAARRRVMEDETTAAKQRRKADRAKDKPTPR